MNRRLYWLLAGLWLAASLQAQGTGPLLQGRVWADGAPLPGATVQVLELGRGQLTDSLGRFSFVLQQEGSHLLRVDAPGFEAWQRNVLPGPDLHIDLVPLSTEAVVITGSSMPLKRSESPVAVEAYGQRFLRINPTPSLFEAVQLIPGVRPQINCSVCNTGDIHLNGLEGPYTLVVLDGQPIVGGLGSVYGLMGIPSGFIQQIEVQKGPAGTQYGSEALGGVVNVVLRDAADAPRLLAEVQSGTWAETSLDLGARLKLGKAQALVAAHGFLYDRVRDLNRDGFTDLALQQRASALARLQWPRPHRQQASLTARWLGEYRWGGQTQWEPRFRGGDSVYGEAINTQRTELLLRYPLSAWPGQPWVEASGSHHYQRSDYGTTPYHATQAIGFAQLVWPWQLHPAWKMASGLAMRYTYYDDNSVATQVGDSSQTANQPSQSPLPGLWTEANWKPNAHWHLLAGLRLDHHPQHGLIPTPRLNVLWRLGSQHQLRLGAGSGFRVVNVFTEDHAALSGARTVVMEADLQPERSWNAQVQHRWQLLPAMGVLELETTLFGTRFSNRILPDYDSNPQEIRYANLQGYSQTWGAAASLQASLKVPVVLLAGITWLNHEVVETRNGQTTRSLPVLAERLQATWSASWSLRRWGLRLDYSGTLTGPMRLPIQPNDYRPEFSPAFSIQNLQLTKLVPRWHLEVYAGLRNLLNFTPRADAILRAHDPFDRLANDPVDNPNGYVFDPSYVYTSFQGLRAVAGLRYALP